MKTLVISNQKGGVGKSTLSLHIAMQAYSQGLKVLFVDFDFQGTDGGNSSKFLRNRMSSNKFFNEKLTYDFFSKKVEFSKNHNFILASAEHNLSNISTDDISQWVENHTSAKPYFDVCIIDTPPTVGIPQVAPMVVTDFVLSPIELTPFSIDGAASMINMISNIKKTYNENIEFLGLLPSRFNKTNNTQKRILLSLQKDYSQFMYPNDLVIPERQAFLDSSYENKPIWELEGHTPKKVTTKVRPIFKQIVNQITK